MALNKLDQKVLEALKEVVEFQSVSDLRQFLQELGDTDPSVFYGVLSRVPSLEEIL
jgi:hypothetical protein